MPSSPHDALFRYTFGKPAHAVGLLRAVLPESVLAGMDWRTLRVVPGTQVDEQLRRTHSGGHADAECLVAAASIEQLDAWAIRVLHATSVPEVFGN